MEGGQLTVVRTSPVCRAPASCAARLTYSPPTHYSTGVPGHITDPFEDNTVRLELVTNLKCARAKFPQKTIVLDQFLSFFCQYFQVPMEGPAKAFSLLKGTYHV